MFVYTRCGLQNRRQPFYAAKKSQSPFSGGLAPSIASFLASAGLDQFQSVQHPVDHLSAFGAGVWFAGFDREVFLQFNHLFL